MCNPTEATQDPFVARVLAGATRAELKAEFNLSSDAVYRRLRRIKEKGISASPATAHKVWSDSIRQSVLAKAEEGIPASRIARELGTTKGAIAGIISRARKANKSPVKESTAAIEKRLRWTETMIGGCRWIEGNLPWAWRWCGKPRVTAESPYCEQHFERIYGAHKKTVTSE